MAGTGSAGAVSTELPLLSGVFINEIKEDCRGNEIVEEKGVRIEGAYNVNAQ
jgi:hypothetical protein